MRLDRFITLNLVQPFRRQSYHPTQKVRLPVLMYHSISNDQERGVHSYYRVCTGRERFAKQMQWLQDNGYRGVTLTAGLAWLDSNAKMEEGRWKMEVPRSGTESAILNSELRTPNSEVRPVAITFDDGFRDFYSAAWPTLQEFGFTATVYLPTAFIGETRRHFIPACPLEGRGGGGGTQAAGQSSLVTPHACPGRECLTWSEVRELHQTGIEFGSHTVHHPRLVEVGWSEIHSEIRDSKVEIEQRLGSVCSAFSYPYAFPEADPDFISRFKGLLADAGYQTNVTTRIGRVRVGEDLLQIRRLPVNQDDDLRLLAAKFSGAYDWVGGFQFWSKNLAAARLPARENQTTSNTGTARREFHTGGAKTGRPD